MAGVGVWEELWIDTMLHPSVASTPEIISAKENIRPKSLGSSCC